MPAWFSHLAQWQRPIIWALLIAFLLHLLLLILVEKPQKTNIELLYSQATEVVLFDIQEDLQLEAATLPETEQPLPVEELSVEEEPPAEELPPVEPEQPLRPRLSKNLLTRSLEIARLEAELSVMQSNYAQQPRVRRISSGARMSSEEALYLRQWEEKVERIGNLNYPEEARNQNLGGRLRLMVVIAADGRILEAQLLTGSGHSLLDNAALRILNLAAPFAPLPESIRAEADVLEIIRTWQFGDGWHAN